MEMFQGLEASMDNYLLARSVLVLFVQVCVLCPRPLVAAFLTRKTCLGRGLLPKRDEINRPVRSILSWCIDAASIINADFNWETKRVKPAIRGEDLSSTLTGEPNSAFRTNLKI